MPGAVVIGVVGGTVDKPRVRPLDSPAAVTPELLASTSPVAPTEVLRFAGPCVGGLCQHFTNRNCNLASKIAVMLPDVAGSLPPCDIRQSCRWFAQEGPGICLKCPQVVTDNARPSIDLRLAADPKRLLPIRVREPHTAPAESDDS